MVPSSREKKQGAYRDLMWNYINGVKDTEDKVTGRKNVITSILTDFIALDLGFFNTVNIRKRVVTEKAGKIITTFRMISSVTSGDRNNIEIKYWSPFLGDFPTVVSVGDDNNIDIILHEIDSTVVGNANHIRGKLNVSNTGTSIGSNNILIDFEPELVAGSSVYGLPELSELMFETEVISPGVELDNRIEVSDASKIMLGGEIFFGTAGAAFASREVAWVTGNTVGFDEPLLYKERVSVGSRVFNHYPETVEVFESTLAEIAYQGNKRIVLSDTGSLHLRDITIGGSFHTKSFFQRSSDNMVIVKDTIDAEYQTGTSVVSAGAYPYSTWDTACSLEAGSTYSVSDAMHSAYIGRVIDVGGSDYIITGFTEDSVSFDSALPGGTVSLSFPAVDEALGGGPSNTELSANVPGNSSIIFVEDTSSFFIGQTVKISEIVKSFVVVSIFEGTITLDDKIFGDSVDDSFYIGKTELPIDIVATKAAIEAGALDLNAYIFGG